MPPFIQNFPSMLLIERWPYSLPLPLIYNLFLLLDCLLRNQETYHTSL
jgi:hypothetical protein